MARLALKELGPQAAGLLCADPSQIWRHPTSPWMWTSTPTKRRCTPRWGPRRARRRDAALVEVLLTGGVPLEDEPEAEWAAPVRERVEYLRQEARLELARDRSRRRWARPSRGSLQAWQACLEADPTDEEAAAALMQLYVAHGRRPARGRRLRALSRRAWPPRPEHLAGARGSAGQRRRPSAGADRPGARRLGQASPVADRQRNAGL